jgi:hypothetical protein
MHPKIIIFLYQRSSFWPMSPIWLHILISRQASSLRLGLGELQLTPSNKSSNLNFCGFACSHIVMCGRLSEGFVTNLKDYCSTAGKNDGDITSTNHCRLNFIPNNELSELDPSIFCLFSKQNFNFQRLIFVNARILALRLPCEPEGSLKDFQSHLNNDCSVFAFGALLKFLDKNWSSLNLEAGDQSAPIVAVKKISL